MKLNYAVTGENRKRLVNNISGILGERAVWTIRTFSHRIGDVNVTKTGVVECEDQEKMDRIRRRLHDLGFDPVAEELEAGSASESLEAEQVLETEPSPEELEEMHTLAESIVEDTPEGTVEEEATPGGSTVEAASEEELEEATPGGSTVEAASEEELEDPTPEELIEENTQREDAKESVLDVSIETSTLTEEPEKLLNDQDLEGPNRSDSSESIQETETESDSNASTPPTSVLDLSRTAFTNEQIQNLKKLVKSKGRLIRKALGADSTEIVDIGDWLFFPWYRENPEGEVLETARQLILKMADFAKNAKRVSAREKDAENEKYAFRCFLLRLGYIGPETKEARKFLMKNLNGNTAFRSGHNPAQSIRLDEEEEAEAEEESEERQEERQMEASEPLAEAEQIAAEA